MNPPAPAQEEPSQRPAPAAEQDAFNISAAAEWYHVVEKHIDNPKHLATVIACKCREYKKHAAPSPAQENPVEWAKCKRCGGLEMIGSDDCRHCGSNFSEANRTPVEEASVEEIANRFYCDSGIDPKHWKPLLAAFQEVAALTTASSPSVAQAGDTIVEIDENGKVYDPFKQVPSGVPIRETPKSRS